jgi:hypothetical protein
MRTKSNFRNNLLPAVCIVLASSLITAVPVQASGSEICKNLNLIERQLHKATRYARFLEVDIYRRIHVDVTSTPGSQARSYVERASLLYDGLIQEYEC